MLDVALGLVSRLEQELDVVVGGQVRRQERDRRQRHRAIAEHVEHAWTPARGSRRFDPPVRRVLGQMQHLRAVGEERRAALAQIQPALVELRQQCDQADRRGTLTRGRNLDLREEIAVREPRHRVNWIRHSPL